MAAEHKLDIFDTLSAIDKRQKNFLSDQPEEARKGFAPPVVLRWAASVDGKKDISEYYLLAINERANTFSKDLWSQHPDLLYRLMASCGLGSKQRHQWIPFPSKSKNISKARDFVGSFYPQYKEYEIDMIMDGFTPETFTEFVYSAGLTPTEEKEVLKSYGIEIKEAKGKKGKRSKAA